MKVRFSERARAYLRAEQSYLACFDKRTARATALQIRKAAQLIGAHPRAGHTVAMVPGIRRYVSPPYVIDYIYNDDTVLIVAIRHGRQNPRVPDQDDNGFDEFEM